jgi:VCBS repeat-containing protein
MAAQSIGKVVIVYGTVKAVSSAGVERVLTPNSPVYANERIVTGTDGSVSLLFTEQNVHLDLGRMSEVVLDEDVYADGSGQYSVAEGAVDVAAMQAALEAGDFDPTTALPAPAAGAGVVGGGPRGGGRHLVIFTPDQLEVIPDSGAETVGISRDFLDPPTVEYIEEEIPPAPEPIAAEPAPLTFTSASSPAAPTPPPDTVPTIGTIEFTLDEANLADGSAPNPGALVMRGTLADLQVDFGPDSPGSLDFGGGNIILIDGNAANSLAIQGLYGTLVINGDGTWSYTLTGNTIDHANPNAIGVDDQVQESFPFSAIDSDGSVTPGGNITVNILDDGPTITPTDAAGEGMVHEDALGNITSGDMNNSDSDLSKGNIDDPTRDTDTVVVDLSSLYSIQAGADGLGSLTYNIVGLEAIGGTGLASGIHSDGEQVYYYQSGNSIVGVADGRTVFTLTLDSAAQTATFNLNDQVDHLDAAGKGGLGDDAILSIDNLGQYIQVVVVDGDGDSASLNLDGRLTINVENDIPVVSVEAAGEEYSKVVGEVLEDGMSRTSDGTNPEDNSEGNRESGESLSSDEYKGDAGTLTQLFTSSVSVGADDPGSTVSTTISLSADGLADLATLYSNGVQLDYSVSGDTLTAKAGAFTVFTLQVNADGSWAFDLQDQLDHVNDGENDENWELVSSNGTSVGGIDFSSVLRATVTVTDADGDTISATSTTGAAEGSFVVKVQDDIPVVSVEAAGEEYSKVVGEVLEDGMSRTSDGTNPEDNSEGNREDGEPLSSDEYNSLLKNSPVRA